jgi:hypothetical protein
MHSMPAHRRFSHASRHARQRLGQRCRIAEHDMLSLLDAGACIDLGRKPGCDRRHLLFWSPIDQQAFVAIRDANTGTLITVLPLNFHDRLAWSVTDSQVAEARLRAARRNNDPVRTRLSIHYLDASGRPKTRCLWKSLPGEGVQASVASAQRNLDALRSAMGELQLGEASEIRFSLREGNAGARHDLPRAVALALLRKLGLPAGRAAPEDTSLVETPR